MTINDLYLVYVKSPIDSFPEWYCAEMFYHYLAGVILCMLLLSLLNCKYMHKWIEDEGWWLVVVVNGVIMVGILIWHVLMTLIVPCVLLAIPPIGMGYLCHRIKKRRADESVST
jgi:hypothetical protein